MSAPAPYDVFVSYAHQADGALSADIQKGLQRFARPWNRLVGLRVYRDRTGLGASDDLWREIRQALDASKSLVLLTNPTAAKSPWIARELRYWLHCLNRPLDSVVLVHTHGPDIRWDRDEKAFLSSGAETVVPAVLNEALEAEPAYVDLRWAESEARPLTLDHSRFREAIVDIHVGATRKKREQVYGEEVQQQRTKTKLILAVLTTISILAIAAIVLGAFAEINRREAVRSLARKLSADSLQARESNLDRAALLALASLRFQDQAESSAASLAALHYSPKIRTLFRYDSGLRDAAFLDDGSILLLGQDRALRVRSPNDPDMAVEWPPPAGEVRSMAVFPSGQIALGLANGDISLSDSLSGPRYHFQISSAPIEKLHTATGPWQGLIAIDQAGGVKIYDPARTAVREILIESELPFLTVSPHGQFLAAGIGEHRKIGVLRLPNGEPVCANESWTGKWIRLDLADTPSPKLRALEANGTLHEYDLTDCTASQQLSMPLEMGHPLVESSESKMLTASINGGLLVADLAQGSHRYLRACEGPVAGAKLVDDDKTIAVSCPDGSIRFLSSDNGALREPPIEGLGEPAHRLIFSPDERRMLAIAASGAAALVHRDAKLALGGEPVVLPGSQVELLDAQWTSQGELRIAGSAERIHGFVFDWPSSKTSPFRVGAKTPLYQEMGFLPDGRSVAWATRLGGFGVSRLDASEPDCSPGPAAAVDTGAGAAALAISPDGRWVAVGTTDGIVTLRSTTGDCDVAGSWQVSPEGGARGLAFSSNSETLAAGDVDGDLWLWRLCDGAWTKSAAPVQAHDGFVSSIAWATDDTLMATGGGQQDGTVKLWSVTTPAACSQPPVIEASQAPLVPGPGPITALHFALSDSWLIGGLGDGQLAFWSMPDGASLNISTGSQQTDVQALAVSKEGRLASIGRLGAQAYIWSLVDAAPERGLCSLANRNLTCDEWSTYLGGSAYEPLCAHLPVPLCPP